jgi:hypothetical protein
MKGNDMTADMSTIPGLKELLEFNARRTAAEELRRAGEEQARAAAERQEALAKNIELRRLGAHYLGALFAELAPAEPAPQGPYVPLILGPGPDKFLGLEMRYDNQARVEKPTLVAAGGPYTRNDYLALPASVAQIAEHVAAAVRNRAQARAEALEQAEREIGYADDQDARTQIVEATVAAWPDLQDELTAWYHNWLNERAAAQRRQSEQKQNATIKRATEAQALIDALQRDPVAIGLARIFIAITEDREHYAEQLELAGQEVNAAHESAEARAIRASERAEEAERKADRLEREKREAEDRAVDAEEKAKKLKKQQGGY